MDFDHNDIVEYMQGLVENYADLEGFYRMDIAEIMGRLRKGIQLPALALESMEGDLSLSKAHNTHGKNLFAFSILKKPTSGNYEEQNDFINDCLLMGMQILARMRRDSKIPNHFLHDNFDVSGVSYGKVGPLYADHLFGYRFEVSLKNKINLKVDISKWGDITEDC